LKFRNQTITNVDHLEKVGVPEVVQEPLDLPSAVIYYWGRGIIMHIHTMHIATAMYVVSRSIGGIRPMVGCRLCGHLCILCTEITPHHHLYISTPRQLTASYVYCLYVLPTATGHCCIFARAQFFCHVTLHTARGRLLTMPLHRHL